MCGIAGIAKLDGKTVDITAFMKALTTMRHRGPDDEDSILLESPSHKQDERRLRHSRAPRSFFVPSDALFEFRDNIFLICLGHRVTHGQG